MQGKAKARTQRKKGLALAGFLFGILGLLGFWIPILGTLLTLFAVILSKMALSCIKQCPGVYGGQALAVAGFFLGLIFLIASILMFIVVAGIFMLGFITGKLLVF
ncbi:hypothetical protein HY493_00165 [Candidatus Woesearchaeota archaeon]|nr:hypothetical protein [Candidatus Woesearchaeota archaeon]